MAASDLTGANVMAVAASLLNDTARTVYTYAAMSPYLRLALQELREYYELHNISVTDVSSAVIQVNAGTTEIVYNGAGTPTNPSLPNDLVEPLQLWQRERDINPYIPMTKREFLPRYMEGIEINQFVVWVWQSQKIIFLPSNMNIDIKIDYTRQLFPDASTTIDENTQINVVNAQTFLENRVASLCAEFIERNITSANSLNSYAALALDRATGIGVKGKQAIFTRRRPFRQGYKQRGWVG